MPTLRHYFELGGPLMWPLLICSVLLLAVLLERFWTLGIRAQLFQRKLDPPRRDAHRAVLPFFKDVPPALGLLGTVIGIVQAFRLTEGRVDASAVGSGLAVACLTTIFGLSIALTATVAGYVCQWLTPREVVADGQ